MGSTSPRVGPRQQRGPSDGAKSSRVSEDAGTTLLQLSTREWASANDEQRETYLKETDESYRLFLDEFFASANNCVDQYEKYSRQHARWRRAVIISTGIVTVVNVLAATLPQKTRDWMPAVAAVCAAGLGILANLESFGDSPGRAQAYRESREIFLDAGREFNRLWDSYVRPFGTGPEACVNASELYRRLASKDRELRLKLKELTKTEKKGTSQKQ